MRVARGWRSLGRAFGLWVAWSGLVLLGSGQAASGAKPAAKATEGAGVKLDFLDPMIREAWDQASIKPSRPASDEEFLRRAYLDVLGRIPNIQEASAFLRVRESGKRG